LISVKRKFNDKQLGNNPKEYVQISSFLKEQPTSFELKFLFQTDLELRTQNCELAKDQLLQIKKALVFFNKITPSSSENNLSRFRDAFMERYEEREIPLFYQKN